MPVPRRRGWRGLCHCFLLLFVFCSLQALHCWQRTFKFGFVPCRYWINACHIRVDPPIATVELNFFPAGCVSVVLVRKLVHLNNHLFGATDFNHCLSEGFVADVPVVDAVVFLFTAFLCKLIRRKVFFTSLRFSIPMTTWSVFSDVEVRYGEGVEDGWDILSILGRRPHTQYMTPGLQWLRQNLHCHCDSALTISEISMFPASLIAFFDSALNALNDCSWSRSFWTACFCGWRVILRISWRMLKFSERFTASSGMPEMLKSMFSSSVARSNLSNLSRLLRWQYSCTVCCFSSPSGFPELSWFRTCCSSSVTGFPDLSEELSSSCNTLTISWVTGLPERSSMGLGDWVGLEEPDWSVSPSDCWTSFPTGRCSTVKPWSCFLFQLRSCLKEIFGGGRGDKYGLSYNVSPLFNLSALTMQLAGSAPWRMIALSDRTSILW